MWRKFLLPVLLVVAAVSLGAGCSLIGADPLTPTQCQDYFSQLDDVTLTTDSYDSELNGPSAGQREIIRTALKNTAAARASRVSALTWEQTAFGWYRAEWSFPIGTITIGETYYIRHFSDKSRTEFKSTVYITDSANPGGDLTLEFDGYLVTVGTAPEVPDNGSMTLTLTAGGESYGYRFTFSGVHFEPVSPAYTNANGDTVAQLLVGTFDYFVTDTSQDLNNFQFAHFTSDTMACGVGTDLVLNGWTDTPPTVGPQNSLEALIPLHTV